MGKLQKIIATALFASALMFSGCGSDNSVSGSGDSASSIPAVDTNDTNASAPDLTIAKLVIDASVQNLVLTENEESRTVKVKAFDAGNAPVVSGIVKVKYPAINIYT